MGVIPAQLIGFRDCFLPDRLQNDNDACPPPGHIVCRNKQGGVASVFEDDIWDFSIYTPRSNSRIIFGGIFSEGLISSTNAEYARSLVKDCKLVIVSLWYRRQLSVNSIMALWISLKHVARYAYSKRMSLREALSDVEFIGYVISGSSNRYQEWMRLAGIYNLTSHLLEIYHSSPNFDVYASTEFVAALSDMASERVDEKIREKVQTPVIPSRLLMKTISHCVDACNLFLKNIDLLRRVFVEYHDSKSGMVYGELKVGGWRGSNATLARQAWAFTIKRLGEDSENLKSLNISHYQDLVNYLAYVQKAAAVMIAQFTGMRSSEVRSIPLNGFTSVKYAEEEMCGFKSYTYKFAGNSPRPEFWVTAKEAEVFYNAARSSASLIYEFVIDFDVSNPDTSPLFPARSGRVKAESGIFDVAPMEGEYGWRANKKFTDNYSDFVVSEADLEELVSISPWVNWERKGISVGVQFPFTWHMYRRSLVVYASRSGMLMPVLSQQLKHPIQEMTYYYAKGSVYAKNILSSGPNQKIGLHSFVHELNEELLVAQVDSIIDDLVDYEGVLFGGAGASIQRAKIKNTLPTIYADMELTTREVKAGRLSYRRTAVGGCASIEPCDRLAFTSIMACIDCDSAVFNDYTMGIMKDQISIWEEEINRFGVDSPYSKQRVKEIRLLEKHIKVGDNLIALKEVDR